jgi:SAM-dependent methyltransferase
VSDFRLQRRRPGYRDFWWQVGDSFPVLTGARSTELYFENEQRLIREALPELAGRTLLKTDLWDEAKNTRILQWVADQGARVYGIDISEPIVRDAQQAFGQRTLRSSVSDVRQLPFAEGSFDAVYSMGTVEHFAETEASVRELARVLKPGGRLILGVPNRHDPFLRSALVWVLSRLGWYGYGFEKSFSRRARRQMLHAAGLEVTIESGILFIPDGCGCSICGATRARVGCHRLPRLSCSRSSGSSSTCRRSGVTAI